MTPTERLNHDTMVFKARIWAYTTAPENHRVEAFQALTEAAEAYITARDTFRSWINRMPPPKAAVPIIT